MNTNRGLGIGASLLVLIALTAFYVSQKRERDESRAVLASRTDNDLSQSKSVSPVQRQISNVQAQSNNYESETHPFPTTPKSQSLLARDVASEKSNSVPLFDSLLLQNESMKKLWDNTGFLGESESAVTVRKWLTMGLVFSPNDDESQLMSSLLQEMNRDPQAVFQVVNDASEEIASDPFMEQVALSVVHNLNLSPNQKSEFYSKVIARPFEISANGNVSVRSANSTNALIYLKSTSLPADHLSHLFHRTLSANRHSPRALQEVKVRILAYFPDANL